MATNQVLQFPCANERPAHLIRVAVPRLNKQDHISEYLRQLETRDYDLEWAEVTETKQLTCAEWNELMTGLLNDRDWLSGKGGTSSWGFQADDNREFFKLSEAERELFKRTAYIFVVAVTAPTGQKIYIDPQGYNYARYVAFDANGLPEGKTRQEIERERAQAEQAEKVRSIQHYADNPPNVPTDHGIRFLWNGLKVNGSPLFGCSYSAGTLYHYPEGTITVYASHYRSFPPDVSQYFRVDDESDVQSDYFDDEKLRVCPNHPLYALVKAAFDAQEAHHARRMAKREAKRSDAPHA